MQSPVVEPSHRHVYEWWHRMINAQDLDGLMELYAEDSTIDSSAVLVLEKDPAGVLRGKDKIRAHFRAFFDLIGPGDGSEWYRSSAYLSDGKVLMWEYPSAGPSGDQLDVVESFDIDQGLITCHRVYWGRVGFKLLAAALTRSSVPA